MKTKSKIILSVSALLVCAMVFTGYRLLFPGISFLMAYMEADNHEEQYQIREMNIPLGDRTIPVRLYTPHGTSKGTIVLVHGVHYDGYNEKRLIHFTSTLAQLGFRVFTPDIDDLKNYNIVEQAVDDIEGATRWFLNESNLVHPSDKIGLWGISFAADSAFD